MDHREKTVRHRKRERRHMKNRIQIQSQFRAMQSPRRVCCCNREIIEEPTRPLIHQEARVWYIEGGWASVRIQGQVFEIHGGNVVSVLPWQITEVLQVQECLRYRLVMYNFEYFNHVIKSLYHVEQESLYLTQLLGNHPVIQMTEKQTEDLGRIFDRIQEECGTECLLPDTKGRQSPYLVNQVVSLILEIIRCGENQSTELEPGTSESQIFSYIYGHLNEKITLRQLSQLFYRSESAIGAYITQTTGLSFFDLLNEMRVVRAIDFLSFTDLNLEELAEVLGFVDGAHFSRVFLERVGMNISEYRRVYDLVTDLCRIRNDGKAYEIVAWIYRNYAEPLTAKGMAEQFQISVKELNRILRYFVEQNFSDFLNRIRVDRASELLLAGEKSILEVAVEVGYSSEKSLTRNFLKYRTLTPMQFRRQNLANSSRFN